MTPDRRPGASLSGSTTEPPLRVVDIIGRAIIEPRRSPALGDPVARVQRLLWEALDPPTR
ncbi:hypothetical protein GCM10007079_41480 [Nocardiopsis terrae]|uniref:Uncharacterized protein n=1 Tax=Nocardiopsis terrae TaxID=372655 RepID=A0ABR9HLZ8_9ACTN|nr:hypothetical protein [Nocardiopsis terrae]MBE1460034.1 hypothetical protein [Nocardiopsis terrae]GHC92813.1 hypothetical protein GCM10007079_41480 [Nocardiopsis terrae]